MSYEHEGRTFFVFASEADAIEQIRILKAVAKQFPTLRSLIEPSELVHLNGCPAFTIDFAGRDATQHLSEGLTVDASWKLNEDSVKDLMALQNLMIMNAMYIPGLRLAVSASGRVSIVGASAAPVFRVEGPDPEHLRQISALMDVARSSVRRPEDTLPGAQSPSWEMDADELVKELAHGARDELMQLRTHAKALRTRLSQAERSPLSDESQVMFELELMEAQMNDIDGFLDDILRALATGTRGPASQTLRDRRFSQLNTIDRFLEEVAARLERIASEVSGTRKS